MRKNYKERSLGHKSRKEKIKEITEQLEAGVKAVFESDASEMSHLFIAKTVTIIFST